MNKIELRFFSKMSVCCFSGFLSKSKKARSELGPIRCQGYRWVGEAQGLHHGFPSSWVGFVSRPGEHFVPTEQLLAEESRLQEQQLCYDKAKGSVFVTCRFLTTRP